MSHVEEQIAEMIFKLGALKDKADNYQDSELAKACMDVLRAQWAKKCKDSLIALEIKSLKKAA